MEDAPLFKGSGKDLPAYAASIPQLEFEAPAPLLLRLQLRKIDGGGMPEIARNSHTTCFRESVTEARPVRTASAKELWRDLNSL